MAAEADTQVIENRADAEFSTRNQSLTLRARGLLKLAQKYFVGHSEAIGVLFLDLSMKEPIFIKSGHEGGPWGGTQRGGVPRMPGWGFTTRAPHQGDIGTHVEGHASAIMWQRRVRSAVLLVDRGMCSICANRLYTTLPPDSTLFVYSDEEGKTTVRASHG